MITCLANFHWIHTEGPKCVSAFSYCAYDEVLQHEDAQLKARLWFKGNAGGFDCFQRPECLLNKNKQVHAEFRDQQTVLIRDFPPQYAYRHMHTKLNKCHNIKMWAISYCISVHPGIIDQALHSLVM